MVSTGNGSDNILHRAAEIGEKEVFEAVLAGLVVELTFGEASESPLRIVALEEAHSITVNAAAPPPAPVSVVAARVLLTTIVDDITKTVRSRTAFDNFFRTPGTLLGPENLPCFEISKFKTCSREHEGGLTLIC